MTCVLYLPQINVYVCFKYNNYYDLKITVTIILGVDHHNFMAATLTACLRPVFSQLFKFLPSTIGDNLFFINCCISFIIKDLCKMPMMSLVTDMFFQFTV